MDTVNGCYDASAADRAANSGAEQNSAAAGVGDQTAMDAHARGVSDGYRGGPYDPALFADGRHGAAYRAGLQEGRTAAIDEKLIAVYGPQSTGSATRGLPRLVDSQPPNAKYWQGFNAGRAMERGQQVTPIPTLAGDEHYQRGIAQGRQSIRDGVNPPQFSTPCTAPQAAGHDSTPAAPGGRELSAGHADDTDGM